MIFTLQNWFQISDFGRGRFRIRQVGKPLLRERRGGWRVRGTPKISEKNIIFWNKQFWYFGGLGFWGFAHLCQNHRVFLLGRAHLVRAPQGRPTQRTLPCPKFVLKNASIFSVKCHLGFEMDFLPANVSRKCDFMNCILVWKCIFVFEFWAWTGSLGATSSISDHHLGFFGTTHPTPWAPRGPGGGVGGAWLRLGRRRKWLVHTPAAWPYPLRPTPALRHVFSLLSFSGSLHCICSS